MKRNPNPTLGLSESARREALHYYRTLDSEKEEAFDRIVRVASVVIDAPIIYISFLDEKREWFKSILGSDITQIEHYQAITQKLLEERTVLGINDLKRHEHLQKSPLVQDHPYLSSFLGVPIIDGKGNVLGCIAAGDVSPRHFHQKDRLLLQEQANHVIALLESRLEEMEKERIQEDLSRKLLETSSASLNKLQA